jgi:serine/threonine protein kinase
MSPEDTEPAYDYKIDIWALGILLFELITGNASFKGGQARGGARADED